jgi:insulysin
LLLVLPSRLELSTDHINLLHWPCSDVPAHLLVCLFSCCHLQSEFAAGVAELAKAKLEKPKRLSELAGRWWGEIYAGTCVFDRQTAEVEVLRGLSPADLAGFTEEVFGVAGGVRRKAVVMIRGANELQQQLQDTVGANGHQQNQAAAAEAPGGANTCAAEGLGNGGSSGAANGLKAAAAAAAGEDDLVYAASAVPAGEAFVLIDDINAFKRGCEVYAAAAGQQQRSSKGRVQLGKGAAAAAESGAVGAAAAAANSEEAAPSKL